MIPSKPQQMCHGYRCSEYSQLPIQLPPLLLGSCGWSCGILPRSRVHRPNELSRLLICRIHWPQIQTREGVFGMAVPQTTKFGARSSVNRRPIPLISTPRCRNCFVGAFDSLLDGNGGVRIAKTRSGNRVGKPWEYWINQPIAMTLAVKTPAVVKTPARVRHDFCRERVIQRISTKKMPGQTQLELNLCVALPEVDACPVFGENEDRPMPKVERIRHQPDQDKHTVREHTGN